MDGKSILNNIANFICQNKNILMFVTVVIYILALYSVLSNNVLYFVSLFTLMAIFLIIKNIFPIKYIIVWTLIFYIGIINTSLRLKNIDELINLAPLNSTISGQIISIPQIKNNNKTQFFFRVKELATEEYTKKYSNEKVLVTLNTTEKLNPYDSYKITGRLSTPFKAGNPSQFDYGNYLRNHDAYAVYYGKEFERIANKPARVEKVLQNINQYRDRILAIHAKNLNTPNLEILGGIVFGDDAVSPPDNIKQSFINSGLLHILAASGMNVAFIFSFFFLILSTLRVNYKLNISIGILTVLVYSLMTGLGASVVRATLMLIFVLIGKLIDRDAHSISLLSFVAFLMLLYNPMYVNDVGFQLSFIVTFGLLLTTPYIIKHKNQFLNWIVGTICIPIIAQLWVVPIQIFYFNNISIYSVFANIMSVPLLAIISFGGFISSLLSIITPIADFVCRVFDWILNPLISILINISDFWGNLPNSTYTTTHPQIIQILIYYIILVLLVCIFNKEYREKYMNLIKQTLLFLSLIFLILLIPINKNTTEITFFDVGNADAFLIKTKDNKYGLIDTGKAGYNGGKSQAEIIILKYLKDNGIKKLDFLILTHFDNDHSGGAVDIIQQLDIKQIYVNNLNHNSNEANNIYKLAKEKHIPLILAKMNQKVLETKDLVLINYISQNNKETDDNEASIITLLKTPVCKILFTGDASSLTLYNLKNYLPPNINVLKIGHHGASNSVNKEVLEYFNPDYAVISVGQNKFNHPSFVTLELLKDIPTLRTDINNSIRIVLNRNDFRILTYDSKKRKYVKHF